MSHSQNARFVGEPPRPIEFEEPAGEGLAREIREALARTGVTVSEPAIWRDCGWSLMCETPRGPVEVSLASVDDGWMLQLGAVRVRGIVDWLLRRRVPDASHECFRMARVIHAMLESSGRYSRILWCVDGYPDEANASSEPAEVP